MVYSRRDSSIDNALFQMITSKYSDSHVLILDLENRISEIHHGWYILKINTSEELLNTIFKLESFVSPRLNFIYVSGFASLLRDFTSRSFQKSAINLKIAAFILSLLQNLSNKIPILIKNYLNEFNGNPALNNVSRYYVSNLIKVYNKDMVIKFEKNGSEYTI